MSLDMGRIVDAEIKRGKLTLEGVDTLRIHRGDVVYHHEWARSREGHTCCIILAGAGNHFYVHDLDAKTLVRHERPKNLERDLGLTILGC